jgi:hypothetical protein
MKTRGLLLQILSLTATLFPTLTNVRAEAAPATIHVGPTHSIKNPAAALEAIAKSRTDHPDQPIDIIIADGIYQLDQPIVLSPQHGGTAQAPVRWKAAPGTTPTFSGGTPITGFQILPNGLWSAKLPENLPPFDQLYVGPSRATRARHPNQGFLMLTAVKEEKLEGDRARQSITLKPQDLTPLANLSQHAFRSVQMLAYHKWDNTRRTLESIDTTTGSITTVGRAMKPWNSWDTHTGVIFENFRAALDQPGEWFVETDENNPKIRTLLYQPRPGESPETTTVIAPHLQQLLILKGTPDRKLTHNSFTGIRFLHTGWPSPPEGFEPQQAAASIEAVIQADHTENITIENSTIAHTGIYGIWFREGCKHNTVRQSHLHDLGAGGLRSGTMNLPATPQAASSHQNFDNNLIRHAGKVFPCAVGVWIGHSGDNRITHNDIGHLPYTGISVGWRWGYDHSEAKRNLIANNHIHHIGDGLLSDMGAVYTLGPSEGTIIRGNHIHHVVSHTYGGWGLYNDEGSTGILMENNLVHHTKSGGYHQHYGKENIIRNNILAFASEQQIQYTRAEPHLSFRFTGNIIFWETGNLLGGGGWNGGKVEFSNNIYWNPAGKTPDTIPGDKDSNFIDPLFKSPSTNDWSLPQNSPALTLGFKPFDTTKAGLYGDPTWTATATANKTH